MVRKLRLLIVVGVAAATALALPLSGPTVALAKPSFQINSISVGAGPTTYNYADATQLRCIVRATITYSAGNRAKWVVATDSFTYAGGGEGGGSTMVALTRGATSAQADLSILVLSAQSPATYTFGAYLAGANGTALSSARTTSTYTFYYSSTTSGCPTTTIATG